MSNEDEAARIAHEDQMKAARAQAMQRVVGLSDKSDSVDFSGEIPMAAMEHHPFIGKFTLVMEEHDRRIESDPDYKGLLCCKHAQSPMPVYALFRNALSLPFMLRCADCFGVYLKLMAKAHELDPVYNSTCEFCGEFDPDNDLHLIIWTVGLVTLHAYTCKTCFDQTVNWGKENEDG